MLDPKPTVSPQALPLHKSRHLTGDLTDRNRTAEAGQQLQGSPAVRLKHKIQWAMSNSMGSRIGKASKCKPF